MTWFLSHWWILKFLIGLIKIFLNLVLNLTMVQNWVISRTCLILALVNLFEDRLLCVFVIVFFEERFRLILIFNNTVILANLTSLWKVSIFYVLIFSRCTFKHWLWFSTLYYTVIIRTVLLTFLITSSRC